MSSQHAIFRKRSFCQKWLPGAHRYLIGDPWIKCSKSGISPTYWIFSIATWSPVTPQQQQPHSKIQLSASTFSFLNVKILKFLHRHAEHLWSNFNAWCRIRCLKICVDLHNLGPPSAALAPFVPGFFSKAIVFVSSSLPVILSHSVCASVCETVSNVAIMWEPRWGFAACTCRRQPSARSYSFLFDLHWVHFLLPSSTFPPDFLPPSQPRLRPPPRA